LKIRIYNMPVVLYGCETWSLTLRGKHRLRVFKNRALRRIFGPKIKKVTGQWRRIIRIMKLRRMRWAGHVARWGEKRNAYRLLVGKPEGRRPLRRPSRRWLDNIRMDLVEGDGVMWTGLVWLRIGAGGELL
jgi:hypothetical protein